MRYARQKKYIPQETYLEPRRRRRLCPAASVTGAILAVALALAACGGGPSVPGVATGSTTTPNASPPAGGSTQATGLLAYASCMRSHGVPNFPDPAGSGGIPKQGVISAEGAVSNSQVNAAQDACRHLLPAGGSLSGKSYAVTAQQQQYYLKAAACMRSHGFTNFPDPNFSGGDVSFPGAFSGTPSPQYTQALKTCQKLIPAGLPYSGPGG
jgi:hypothetical protein